MRFEWDAANEAEVLKHRVTPAEAEEAYADVRAINRPAYDKDGERREATVGRSLQGRVLTVVYTRRGATIRVVTAYPTGGRLLREYLEDR